MRNLIRVIWYLPQKSLLAIIELYQATISPDHSPLRHLNPYGFCWHHPTCSEFARRAILEKGVMIGGFLSLQRILSCTPWKTPSAERIMEICYKKGKL